jgi:hypothetical protein|tara:strand:+ start:139 stop:351 length:213 start_codon:yes stop_codon:yes gene_type:complete
MSSKEVVHYTNARNGRVYLSFFNCKTHTCLSKDSEGIMLDIPIEFAEQIAMKIQYENEIEGMAKQHGEKQ